VSDPFRAPLPRRVAAGVKVAPLKAACSICQLDEGVRIQVNRVVWDEQTGKRTSGYRMDAIAVLADLGYRFDRKVIGRHAAHVEASWREATSAAPATQREEPIFSTEFVSVTDAASKLGMRAMHKLDARISAGAMEDRDLVAVGKLGLSAAGLRAQVAMKRAELNLTAQAIFGLASDHLEEHESEIKDVTPIASLHAEIDREREELLLAAGRGG